MHSVGDVPGSRAEILSTCTGAPIDILPPRERTTDESVSGIASVRSGNHTFGPIPYDAMHSGFEVSPPLSDVGDIYNGALLVGLSPHGYTTNAAFADIVSVETASDEAFSLFEGDILHGWELSRTHTEVGNTATGGYG